jgi:hypothetical protein
MSTFEVDRPFLTFHELALRWRGDSNSVRSALVKAGLVPTVYLSGLGTAEGAGAEDGLFYLHRPQMTAVLDCTFTAASRGLRFSEGEQSQPLPQPMPLEEVLAVGVVDIDQVESYERAHPRKISLSQVRTDLKTQERASLLKLVIGMAIRCYAYEPKDRRSNVIPEIAGDVRGLGMTIDDDTVRKYVYEGVESHLPINWKDHSRTR